MTRRQEQPNGWRVVLVLLAALLVAACGGAGSKSSSSASRTRASTQAVPTTGGNQAAIAIVRRAAAALGRVRSFHIQGVGTLLNGAQLALSGDIEIPGRLRLTLQEGLERLSVVVVGQTSYVKANRAFWLAQGPRAPRSLANRWVKLPATASGAAQFLALTNPRTDGACLLERHLGTLSVAGTASIGGQPTVVIIDHGNAPGGQPGKLYVPVHGQPLPVRAVETGPQRPGGQPDTLCGETGPSQSTTVTSTTSIGRYDEPVQITAPQGAISPPGSPTA